MNISVADDHAKQRFGLFEHRYDLRPYLDNLGLFYWLSVEADSATTDAKINTTPAPALRVEPEKESDLIGETVYQPQISV